MPWIPPRPPTNSLQARVAYWRRLLEIPHSEPSAVLLQSMAARRLLQLGVLSDVEVQALRALLDEPCRGRCSAYAALDVQEAADTA